MFILVESLALVIIGGFVHWFGCSLLFIIIIFIFFKFLFNNFFIYYFVFCFFLLQSLYSKIQLVI